METEISMMGKAQIGPAFQEQDEHHPYYYPKLRDFPQTLGLVNHNPREHPEMP